jgi:putative membrane protein
VKQALIRWLVLTVAVWIAAGLIRGIEFEHWPDLLFASLVLGVLNTFVKPVLQLLALPVVIISLGFFLLVINALLLKLTAMLVTGFHVQGFWPAVGGSLIISVVSFFLGYSGRGRRIVINRRSPRPIDYDGPPPGKGPVIDV